MKQEAVTIMISSPRDRYLLLLSEDPVNLFTYFRVDEMHGLNIKDCMNHPNTKSESYIAGMANYWPNDDRQRFIYINLKRCSDPIEAMGLIMHETMHHSLYRYHYDVLSWEEEIISWAEEEAKKIYDLVYRIKI
jgi:hypothetical protein